MDILHFLQIIFVIALSLGSVAFAAMFIKAFFVWIGEIIKSLASSRHQDSIEYNTHTSDKSDMKDERKIPDVQSNDVKTSSNNASRIYIFPEDEYIKNTGRKYGEIFLDKGNTGEYLIYKCLKDFRGYKKFLFNLYIPTAMGTTEIDVVMLHTSGIYVFESKNYSGWIFGSENQQYWTQCLYSRTGSEKHRFYNPIIQNKSHIRHLKKFLAGYGEIPVYSFVVFGDDCELKKINLTTQECIVVKRDYLYHNVKLKADYAGNVLTEEQINKLYDILNPCSHVSEQVKKEHIRKIKERERENDRL